MTTKDYLVAARAKIADESNWTQHALARDADGNDKPSSHPLSDDTHWEGLDGRDPQACRWCAMGAVQAVTPTAHEQQTWEALDAAAAKIYHATVRIPEVNDDIGHAAVLAVTPTAHEQQTWEALDAAAAKIYHAPVRISEVNDDIGHAAVLACFDQAIKDAA